MKNYLKKYGLWMGLSGVMMCIMALLMRLNDVKKSEIIYAFFVGLFLVLLVCVLTFYKEKRRIHELKNLEQEICFSLGNLPEAMDGREAQYQKLLALLMEEKNRVQNEQELKLCDLREYFSLWVHQVKTPISAMRLLLQEKGKQIDLSEEQEELFEMEQYVAMVLQYVRLNSETTDFVFGKTLLDGVIRDAIRKYARIFVRKKIKLEYEGTKETMITDGKWLGFIIEQLLSNALKYTPEGSVKIVVSENAIIIEDTGIGIEAEDLPRIFEKGYTGFNGHANQHSSGIGLYLCEKIAKKLSQEIQIQSKIGVGTQVKVVPKGK